MLRLNALAQRGPRDHVVDAVSGGACTLNCNGLPSHVHHSPLLKNSLRICLHDSLLLAFVVAAALEQKLELAIRLLRERGESGMFLNAVGRQELFPELRTLGGHHAHSSLNRESDDLNLTTLV